MVTDSKWHAETLAIVAGRAPTPGGPFNVPPTFASTYRDGGDIGYGRWGNPTWSAFEEALGELEGGYCVSFASGTGRRVGAARFAAARHDRRLSRATATTARAVSSNDWKRKADSTPAPSTSSIRTEVLEAMDGADMLWLESPTNPMLGVADLPTILQSARDAGVVAVVDNTFATPMLQQPLALGASAVVHSATKYIGGHSDLLMGAVIVADERRRDELIEWRTIAGRHPRGDGGLPRASGTSHAARSIRSPTAHGGRARRATRRPSSRSCACVTPASSPIRDSNARVH